ncbi:MAG: hypothetical protein H0X13_15625 [Ramlibacter sp.]|nr:hypothetical protein [Ramlibacter sp.]
MKTIFLLMWLADIAGSIGVIGAVSAIVFISGAVLAGLLEASEVSVWSRYWKFARWLLLPVVIATALPDTKTIRILAVAHAAEMAANTTLGAKAIEALDAVLARVIVDAKAK